METETFTDGYDEEYLRNLSDKELTALLLAHTPPDYDFADIENSSSTITGEELRGLSPVIVSYSIIFLLGVIGNSLVIYCVAKYKRMKSNTNQLLLSLACADLLVILICIPVKFARLFSYGWAFGAVMCKLTHYIQNWSMVTSVMTLTAISVERYYAISQPLKAKSICTTNHARAVILSIWIASSALSLPIVFVQNHYEIGPLDPIYRCDKYYMDDRSAEMLVIGYEIYMLALLFVIPVIVMFCTYVGVCIQLWAATDGITHTSGTQVAERTSLTAHNRSSLCENVTAVELISKSETHVHNTREAEIRVQVLKMLFVVVIIFIICWCPILCYNLIVATGLVKPYIPQEYPYASALNKAFSLLAYANSCLNPIVYGFMSKYFRKSFKQALSNCCLLQRRRRSSYNRKRYTNTDRSSSSLRKNGDCTCGADAAKRNTLTTIAADSTLSRSPPVSPHNTFSAN